MGFESVRKRRVVGDVEVGQNYIVDRFVPCWSFDPRFLAIGAVLSFDRSGGGDRHIWIRIDNALKVEQGEVNGGDGTPRG